MKPGPNTLHLIAILGFLGLFALLMLWNTVLTPPAKIPTSLLLLITITPLLLPARGFFRGRPRSCAWMAYASLIYFLHGSAEAYASPSVRHLATLEVVFSLILFFSATYYIRSLKSPPPDGRTTPDRI